jgi:hypothetical protein
MKQYSSIKNIKTMDSNSIVDRYKKFEKEIKLVVEYFGFKDWEEMIQSIEREKKIENIIND